MKNRRYLWKKIKIYLRLNIRKKVLLETLTSQFRYILHLKLDVKRIEKTIFPVERLVVLVVAVKKQVKLIDDRFEKVIRAKHVAAHRKKYYLKTLTS